MAHGKKTGLWQASPRSSRCPSRGGCRQRDAARIVDEREGAPCGDAKTTSMWTQGESGRVSTPLEPIVLGATLLLIPALIIQADVNSGPWLTVAYVINWAVWGIFVAEYALIMIVAPRKRAALRAHWLDLVLILVTSPVLSRFIAGLRLVRLARLLRLVRATTIVTRAIQAERSLASGTALRLIALITVFIVVI